MRSLRLCCGLFRPPINAADLAGIWCVGSDAAFALCRRRCSIWRKGCRQSIRLHWLSSALWLEFKLCMGPMKLTRGWFLALSVMWLAISALMLWLGRIWDACGAFLAATAFVLVAFRRKRHFADGSPE